MKNLLIFGFVLQSLALFQGLAYANPIVASKDGTATIVLQNGKQFTITGGTLSGDGHNLFHSFESFGLNAQQIANFLSNPSIRNILARVTGGNPSVINGLIQLSGGNSNLFLVNPAGIVFGKNATINVPASFMATTANRLAFAGGYFNAIGSNNYSLLSGYPQFLDFQNNQAGTIINAGNLSVNFGHNIALIGANVINTGTLNAPGGDITISAVPGTNRVRITPQNSVLSLEVVPPTDAQGNSLPITVLDLPGLLTQLPSQIETGLTVTSDNQVQLNKTDIPTDQGIAIVSGLLNVQNPEALAGQIKILGKKIGIINGKIDASGAIGGGNILIGGDYKGQGIIPKADLSYIDSNSIITADAISNGNGGNISIWSEKSTRVDGFLSAKGGQIKGDGGFIETSSHGDLVINQAPDLSSHGGKSGTWLLDPYDITISSSNQNLYVSEGNPFEPTYYGSILNTSTLLSALSSGNVVISTDSINNGQDRGNITLANNLDYSNIQGSNTLTLKTAPSGKIILQGSISTSNQNYININFNGPVLLQVDLGITGNNIAFNSTIDSHPNATGSTLRIFGSGITTFNGDIGSTNIIENVFVLGTGKATVINANLINTKYNQIYNEPILLASDTSFVGNSIVFSSTIDSNDSSNPHSLTATPSSIAHVNFYGNVGSLNPLSSLTINGNTKIKAGSSSLTTVGYQNYNGSVNLETNTNLTSSDGNLNFNNIDGNYQLTTSANATTFNGPVNVNTLRVDGIANINTNQIATTADQNYNGPVNLETNTNLTSSDGNLNFNNIDGNYQLATSANATTFNAPVNVNALSVDGITNVNTNQIITLGNQVYNGPVNLKSDSNITSSDGNLKFNNIDGNYQLTTSANATTFNAPVNVNALSVDGVTNIKINQVTTNGGTISLSSKSGSIQTGDLNSSGSSGGNIALQSATTITTGKIDSSGSLFNAGNVNISTAGNIVIDSINSQAGQLGHGGKIDISSTSGLIQITNTFDGINSISTQGSLAGDSINLIFNGNGETPFIVGITPSELQDKSGSVGAIKTSQTSINPRTTYFDNTVINNLSIYSGSTTPQVTYKTSLIPLNTLININISNPDNIERSNKVISKTNYYLNQAPSSPEILTGKIEQSFTTNFGTYLNLETPKILTLKEEQNILKQRNINTKTKSSLIYIYFKSSQDKKVTSTDAINLKNQISSDLSKTQDTDQLEIILVTAEQTIIHSVKNINRGQVISVVKQLQQDLTNVRRPLAYQKSGQQLYKWLISPIESDLKSNKINNLIFILDEGLRSLPIAALQDGNAYILENYSINIMPSVSVTNTEYRDLRNQEVLAMGASEFSDKKSLPAVPLELSIITKQLWKGRSYLNSEFTINNLNKSRRLGQFHIIHIATHANFETGSIDRSYIQFWNEKLSLNLLRSLKLGDDPSVDLLVLSACRTALGNKQTELGFAGAAFLANVKTVLASLWEVSDEGTLGLMTSFYSRLKLDPIKAEALRQAQLSLINGKVRIENGQLVTPEGIFPLPAQLKNSTNKSLKHPYFWSGFTMIGSPW